MTPTELRDFLTRRGIRFTERQIQHGAQFRCEDGEVFSVYTKSGKVVSGGKKTQLHDDVL